MYAPPAHEVALAFDRPLVVGGRGTGKSYWAAALCHAEARKRLMKPLSESQAKPAGRP